MTPTELDHILITGACEHNLKSVDLAVPKKKLVVFTGPSGSGKTSLAFDTLYAEGQRRYVESLSAYARQFLGQAEKPKYDKIRGLSPAISIDQKTTSHNPRSTVGTVTEIYDYLRLLYARLGQQRCYSCGRPVGRMSAQTIVGEIMKLPAGTRFYVLAPLVRNRKGAFQAVFDQARQGGFARVRVDGLVIRLDESAAVDKKRKHDIDIVVDRLVAGPDLTERVTDAVETALRVAEGRCAVQVIDGEETLYSENLACARCGLSFPELSPQSFSFNSPLGMCRTCNGLGTQLTMDPNRVVPDKDLSVRAGAIRPWANTMIVPSSWTSAVLEGLAAQYGIDLDAPFRLLPAEHQEILLFGAPQKVAVRWQRDSSAGSSRLTFEGAINALMRRMKETTSEMMRAYYATFMTSERCTACNGTRLRPESRSVYIAERSIADVCALPVREAHAFFECLSFSGGHRIVAEEILKEIRQRLSFLMSVGLGYLAVDRASPSLSGGENQRIRLASQIGTELTGVIYILDEPSIGLHQRDNIRLLSTLKHLRDIGNTVIVVEHDAETMLAADWIVDFGPGAGARGGHIVYSGPPDRIGEEQGSVTGRYLSGREEIPVPERRRSPVRGRAITVRNARENNLAGIDVSIPIGLFTCITGVSGAGKSTLVNDILFPAARRRLGGMSEHIGAHDGIEGLDSIDKVIEIDQSPIGRTPRSNPATYTKLFDPIRLLFAELPDARIQGYDPGRFSFNVRGGRCEACEGDGTVKVEMHFLADVHVPCEQCKGKRFNDATLKVRFKGKNIAEVLELTVDEARELFDAMPKITRILDTLIDVGLGYMQLGQPSTTLSGGEAQRIKLSRELAKIATGDTLYILDEPSTGLHFEDIRKLLSVIGRLVDAGNTVVMIEHNLDIIKTADWIIDLGPDGGDAGGQIVAAGSPEQVAEIAGSFTGQFLRGVLQGRRCCV
ncbi:MAG: excinuclease ABC subunit UvrA [Candidatus Schekmanbacteria bacterium]|nr:excinuclease ABC subunit UvrA [Candidatus Schekmanbacteria bacterium]